MGFMFNGLTGTSVTISGSVAAGLPTPTATQTIQNKTATSGDANYHTIHTVTAGKTLYITDIVLTETSGTNCNFFFSIDNGASALFNLPVSSGVLGGNSNIHFVTPIKVAASEVVAFKVSAGNGKCLISGFEV